MIPDTETEIKFETYRFYLESLCIHLKNLYKNWKNFGEQCIAKTQKLQGMQSFDHTWIERWMKISWNTEYLMSVGADDIELMRINNQWTPIQCYYAIYAAAEALTYVIDGHKADGHHKSLRKITDYLVKGGLSPWDKAFKGPRGKSRNEHLPINFEPGLIIPNNLQRYGVTPLQMIAKCLKAEHSHRIDDLFEKKIGCHKYRFDPGHTGLFHFIYRLRVKSNYKDVDIFVYDAPEEHIRDFSNSLNFFCFWSLLYMEIMLIRKCRKKHIIDLAEKYLKLNPRANQLSHRLDYYKTAI